MKKEHIVLLTGNKNFFGQTRKPWVSMDIVKIETILRQSGFSVERYAFHEIINRDIAIRNSILFYSFSQKRNGRAYLSDAIHYLNDGTNFLIPSYDLLRCHENKGYQELFKKKIGLSSLKAHYFSSAAELDPYDITYPVVFKTTEGTNAKTVFLAKNKKELLRIIRKNQPQDLLVRFDLIRRKYFRGKKDYPEYPDYSNRKDYEAYRDYILTERNFIVQEFIPNLTFDFRVLILYDRYYVMKRHTRTDDFRASGTKLFDFDFEIESPLLDYARSVFEKFSTPYLSMDIIPAGQHFALLEFQALHFGMSAVVKSRGYYRHQQGKWEFVHSRPQIEEEMARALITYIRNR